MANNEVKRTGAIRCQIRAAGNLNGSPHKPAQNLPRYPRNRKRARKCWWRAGRSAMPRRKKKQEETVPPITEQWQERGHQMLYQAIYSVRFVARAERAPLNRARV